MNKIKCFALALSTFAIQTAVAQNEEDTLRGGAVIIVKEFEPTISDASKILEEPKIKPIEAPKINFKYRMLNKRASTSFLPDSIKAANMRGEPLDRLYRGYFRGGIGNYGTTNARLHLNNLRSRNGLYGVELSHIRTQGNIRDVATSTASENEILLNGTRFFKYHSLSGNVGYSRNTNHFYGFDTPFYNEIEKADDIDKASIEQFYSKISANASFKSFYADSTDLNYRFDADYYFLEDAYQTKEHNVLVNANLNKFFNKEQAFLNLVVDHNNYQSSLDTISNTIIGLNPQIVFRGKEWRVSLGLNAMSEFEDGGEFRFYPKADLKYSIANDLLIPFVGITGGLKRQNFNSVRNDNPFINPAFALANKNTRYKFYGGVRGAYNSTLSFSLIAERSQVANYAMYVNSAESLVASDNEFYYADSQFNVLYDTLDITHISGEISFNEIDRLKVIARGDFWSYNPKNQPEVWHLPEFKGTLTAHYDMHDKIVLRADIFYISKQFARTFDETEGDRVATGIYAKELKGTIDINLAAEYRLNKKLSGFVRLNNIAAIEYERFNNYPTQRFNFLAGISYSFWGE